MKSRQNSAWFFLVPALLVMAINAFLPFITVINYSLQDIFAGLPPIWIGLENYAAVLESSEFKLAFSNQVLFSTTILLIQVPLGILVALWMPRKNIWATVTLVLLGLPLLIPWNIVGIIWRVFTRSDIGIVPGLLAPIYDYNLAVNSADAWWTVVIMDVWHWTPLIALLCYAGRNSIPDAYYQAAKIDGASSWKIFRYVTLPRLRNVLTIGILLRFMDSFRIFTEVSMLTGSGPGTTTTFLSQPLVTMVEGSDFGRAGAYSLIYFFVILVVSYVFFLVLTNVGTSNNGNQTEE